MTEQTDTVTCKYPGCDQPARQAPKTGRPPEYCDNPEHDGVTAWRERKRLAVVERGVTTSEAETEQPVTMARVTGADLLRQMSVLADKMTTPAGRLINAVETIGDTGAAEAEVESVRAAAERRAATAEDERAAAERRVVDADQRAAVADEAADRMSEHLAAEVARARKLMTAWPRPPPRTPPSSSGSARKPRPVSPSPRKTGTARSRPLRLLRPLLSAPLTRGRSRPRRERRRRSPRPGPRPRLSCARPARPGTRPSRRPPRRTSGPPPPGHAPRTHAPRPRGSAKTPRASGTNCGPAWKPRPGCSRNHAASCAPAPSGPSVTLTPRGPSSPGCARRRRASGLPPWGRRDRLPTPGSGRWTAAGR